MSVPKRFRFTLTKQQVNDVVDDLLLDGDEYADRGVEQPDGTRLFDFGHEDLEVMVESLAAACNHADDQQTEARLHTIYKKLVKLLEG
jgi:hypothetical protein